MALFIIILLSDQRGLFYLRTYFLICLLILRSISLTFLDQVCALPKLTSGPSSMGYEFCMICMSQPLGYSMSTSLITFSKAKLNKAVKISIYLNGSHGHHDFYNHKKKQQVIYNICTRHTLFL